MQSRIQAQSPAPDFLPLVLTASLGALIAPLNSTMIAVALPAIREDFGVSSRGVTWLVTAYLIAMLVAMPVGGSIGDQAGRGRVITAGLLALLPLSLAAALAPGFELLVALRVLQAVAGAAVIANCTAMMREGASSRFGEANGILGAAIGVSVAIGPVLGAGLLEVGSWRLLFLVNLPLAGLCLYLVSRYFPRGPQAPRASKSIRIDWLAIALLAGLLVCLSILVSHFDEQPPVQAAALSVAAAVFGIAFLRRQWGSPAPIAGWHLFRTPSFAAGASFVLLSNLVMYTYLLALPFFLTEVQARDDAATGAVLGAMALLMIGLAPTLGRLSDRRGRRLPAAAGGLLMAIASIALAAGISDGTSLPFVGIAMGVLGLGLGLGMGPASAAAIEAAPDGQAGIASGTISMMRYTGSVAGSGLIAAIIGSGEAPEIEAFRWLFLVAGVTSALTIVAASRLHDHIEALPGSNSDA